MTNRLLAVMVLVLALCSIGISQVPTTDADLANKSDVAAVASESAKNGLPAPATSWTRIAFEAGVNYGPSDQIGSTTTTCPGWGWAADWYGHSLSWTTGGPASATTSGAVPKAVNYNGAIRYV